MKNIIDIYISKIDFYSINELVISVPKIIHWKLLRSFRFPRSIGNINFHSINEFFFLKKKQRLGLLLNKTFFFIWTKAHHLLSKRKILFFNFPLHRQTLFLSRSPFAFSFFFSTEKSYLSLIILRPLLHKWKTFDLSARKLIKIFY